MPTLTKFATSNAVITGTAFTNPTNAYTDDGNLATLTSNQKNQFPVGEHGWGFPGISTAEIPDGSTIDAVRCVGEMGLTVAVTGGEMGLNGIANGTADPGTEQTKSTAGLGILTYTYVTIPSLANLRTAGYYQASVRYRRGNTTVSSTAQVDYLKLEIDWTAGGTQYPQGVSGALSFSGSVARAAARVRTLTAGQTFAGALSGLLSAVRSQSGDLSFAGDLTTQYTAAPAGSPALTAVHIHTE